MSRQRIVDIALAVYPRSVRDAHGVEMRDTALDLAGNSIWRLMLESLGLARGGLNARACVSAPGSKRDLLSDCCARTVTVYGLVTFTLWLGSDRWISTSSEFAARSSSVIAEWLPTTALLALATGLALAGYRRLAGLSGVAWVGFYLAVALSQDTWWARSSGVAYEAHWVAFIVVPVACYLVMIILPGTRPRHSRRLGWLLGAWLIGGIVAPPQAPLELFASIGFENVLLIAILVAGVCLLATDTWRPIAFALALLAFGLGAWTWDSFFGTYEYLPLALTTLGPLVLMAAAAARLLSARRGLPN